MDTYSRQPTICVRITVLTIYIQVDDLQASLEKAESLGGQTLVPPRPIPSGMGAFAMFLDPSGNCIGLYQPND